MTHNNFFSSRQRAFRAVSVCLAIVLFCYTFFVSLSIANAAALTTLSNTMSTLETSAAANHDIKFRTPTGMSSGTIVIDFNTAGFSSGSVDYTDIDLQYGSSSAEVNGSCSSNCTEATLAAAAGAGAWGAAFATNDLTFSYPTSGGTAIASNDYVRVLIGLNASEGEAGNQRMSNPGSTGSKVITINVGTGPLDTGKLAVVILSDNTQLVQTTIDPYLTFTMDQASITLTKSGGGNPTYTQTGFNNGTANTLTAATNANSGYTMSYYGDTLKTAGGANSIDAMAAKAASSTGVEQFGFNLKDNATPNTGADPSGGSGAAASDYNTADQFKYVVNTTTTMASASAASATSTFTASYIVNLTETTEAGAYSTTITYVCTGNF